MNSDPKDSFENADPQTSADMLMAGVMEVATTALAIGASLLKTLAQETAGGKPVPEPEGRVSPLNTVVYYGVATVTNVVKLVVSEVGVAPNGVANPSANSSVYQATELGRTSVAVERSSDSSPQSSVNFSPLNLPTVHCGGVLRIPLSIENPSVESMDNMAVRCLSLDAVRPLDTVTEGSGQIHNSPTLRFQPATLSIAPKDFEKLTVFIETQPGTRVGDFRAVIGIGAENFETTLQFRVIAAA